MNGPRRATSEPSAEQPELVVTLKALRDHCGAILESAGLEPDAAALVADSLSDAEARDIRSHGVCRTRIYAERLRAGLLEPAAVPRVVNDAGSGVLVDAGNAIGHVGARAGVDLAIERASANAVCVVGVRNSNHCGTLAYFVRRATASGLAVVAASNAPPTMTYHGGRTRAVGTNPFAIGVSRGTEPPIVLDMATSATARGKIILAHQLETSIPDGWAVDPGGLPTTDPELALQGSVVPFAGPKGSGLAMMIDLLCGGLLAGVTGDQIGDMYEDWTRPQRVSHLFVTINPDVFVGRQAFQAEVVALAERLHALPPSPGVERILLPGEPEELARRTAERVGVLLSATVVDDLEGLAREFGAPTTLRQLTG